MEIPPRLFLLLTDCPPGQTAWDCVQSGSEYLHRWRHHILLLCLTTFIIKKKKTIYLALRFNVMVGTSAHCFLPY